MEIFALKQTTKQSIQDYKDKNVSLVIETAGQSTPTSPIPHLGASISADTPTVSISVQP